MPTIPHWNAEEFLLYVDQSHHPKGCWEWTGSQDKGGYGKYGKRLAHRLSYSVFVGPIPRGALILHTCDNPPCVRPEHLYAGTPLDNMRDMSERQRFQPRVGELNTRAILTENQVREIRQIREETHEPYPAIAARFGVSTATISLICLRIRWKHVE